VDVRYIALVGAALLVGAGCSPPQPAPKPPGALPSGTAEMTIDGLQTATSHSVSCVAIQSMTTITTGSDAEGVTAVVDNSGKLAADSISIRNVGGFTGSYWRDLSKDADVSMAGTTLTITGTADGYKVDNPSFRTTGSFKFKASC
jgi:ipoprotein LpqH